MLLLGMLLCRGYGEGAVLVMLWCRCERETGVAVGYNVEQRLVSGKVLLLDMLWSRGW